MNPAQIPFLCGPVLAQRYSVGVSSEDLTMAQEVPSTSAKFVVIDGYVRQCSASLWVQSPILRNLPPGAMPVLNCDDETWLQLEIVHRGGPFPTDFRDIYELLMVTVPLKLDKLTRLCLKNLFGAPDSWDSYYPYNISDEIVLLCFRESLTRLFRTEDIYQLEVEVIIYHSYRPHLAALLTSEINLEIEKFKELELEPVPVLFRTPLVPIMIMKRRGETKTAICSGECQTFELFGKHFDLSASEIDAFHLRYASYLLYKSGERVYFKDLRCNAEAVLCLDNCKFFISRKDSVLAVTKVKSEYCIQTWIEDGGTGRFSAVLYSTSEEIKSVDHTSDGAFLILTESGSLLIAHFWDPDLVIADSGEGYHSAWFHNGDLYTLRFKRGQSDDFEMYRMKQVSAAVWEYDTEFSEWQSLEEFAKGGRITSIGGELFRFSGKGLEMYSTSGPPILMLSSEEYVASSELHLHP